MRKPLSPITNEQELVILQDSFFKNRISRKDMERLFEYYRQQLPSVKDTEISLMLLTSHPDYGKADEHGEIRII